MPIKAGDDLVINKCPMTWTLQSFYWLLKNHLIHICNVLCNIFHMNVFTRCLAAGIVYNALCPTLIPKLCPLNFIWEAAWGPSHKGFMRLSFKSCENSVSFYLNSNDPIRSQFFTCHNSLAVMACAKLWHDCIIIIFYISVIFIFQILWWAHKPFAKWVSRPSQCLVFNFSPVPTYSVPHRAAYCAGSQSGNLIYF